jgi:hypothetical protein
MKTTCLAAALALLTGTAAFGQAAEVQAVAPPEGAANQEEKRICKVEKVTGSLTNRRRICMTQSDWEMIAQKTGTAMDRLKEHAAKNHAVYANPIGFQ